MTISHTLPTRGNEPVDRRRLDASVLVVDDDPGTRETFDWALRSCGVRVRTSASGADAIELAQTHTFDLLLLDLELRDMRGTDVIRVVRTPTVCVPFVLISAFLTTEVTVEAMRLGALHVLDKPVSIDDLPPLVVAALAGQRAPKTRPRATVLANLTRLADTKHARSTAERWAFNVIKGCLAEADPRTLKEWAENAAVSYTTLRESCALVGIEPYAARDLMRMLRVLLHSAEHREPLDVLLHTADGRTLARLIAGAGLESAADLQSISIEDFFSRQCLVASASETLLILRDLVLRCTA